MSSISESRDIRDAPTEMPRYRLTVRARLALTYAALLSGAGLIMLAIIFVVVGLLPTFDFAVNTTPAIPADGSPAAPAELTPSFVVASRADVLRLLLIVSVIVFILLAAGGLLAGWYVAGRMLRPLRYMDAAARRATQGHLDHRLNPTGPRDEITDLAHTFDGMLAALERSLDSYRRFAQNASHELRTPLATTRAMLDVALGAPSNDTTALLTRLRNTNERSIVTVDALLDLAEINATTITTGDVDLARLVDGLIDDVGAEAARTGIVISATLDPALVAGDPALLRQLVLNLLHNAIRHNTPGGWVTVETRSSDRGEPILQISNGGDLIPASGVERLSEPFHRAAGRTSKSPTTSRGLGLSIVSAIAERHQAELLLSAPVEGGLIARIVFPHRPDESRPSAGGSAS